MHGLTYNETEDAIGQWWDGVATTVGEEAAQLRVVGGLETPIAVLVFADANVDICRCERAPHMVSARQRAMVCAASGFLESLQLHSVAEVEGGNMVTYSGHGHECRLDHVWATADYIPEKGSAYVQAALNASLRVDDHRLLGTRVHRYVSCSVPVVARRRPAYDRRGLIVPTPGQVAAHEALMVRPPLVPANVEPTAQQAIIDRWHGDILSSAFPVRNLPGGAQQLSDDTLAAYVRKREVAQRARAAAFKAQVCLWFWCWRDACKGNERGGARNLGQS